jgi:hypothetical protein
LLITYNPNEHRFELVLQSGAPWQAEMQLAQSAGFKCDGPPSWTWATMKALTVAKLKENRPAILEITPQALEEFNKLISQEQENQKIIDQVKELKKEQRKREKKQERIEELLTSIPTYWQGKDEIGVEDLPQSVIERARKREIVLDKSITPDLKCQYCHEPIYYYETQEPPTCIWCEVAYDEFQKETGL